VRPRCNTNSDNRAANRIILAIFATGVGGAVLLIASRSRPFTGEISVRPTVLLQIMPEAVSEGANPLRGSSVTRGPGVAATRV
jgi:hypothetical protein